MRLQSQPYMGRFALMTRTQLGIDDLRVVESRECKWRRTLKWGRRSDQRGMYLFLPVQMG